MNVINDKYVADLIIKKSTKFLKVSISLFIVSLILLTTFLCILTNQYLQIMNDFVENKNTHIVEVSLSEKNDFMEELTFDDVSKIETLLGSLNDKKIQYDVMQVLQFNIGFEDKDENIQRIIGLDDEFAKLIGVEKLEYNNIYSPRKNIKNKTILNLPVIETNDSGIDSNQIIKYDLINNKHTINEAVLTIYEPSQDNKYISISTYKSLIQKMFNTSWSEFVKGINEGENFGIQPVKKITVYVHNVVDVETVAKVIDDNGYATSYTFKVFDNFDESIRTTSLLVSILLLILYIVTAVLIIFSFNSYLKIQQKDMGILLHHGFGRERIYKIYSQNVNKIFVIISIIIVIFTGVLGLLLLGLDNLIYIALIMIITLLLIIIVNRIIILVLLKSYVKKNFLDLVKNNKEFE